MAGGQFHASSVTKTESLWSQVPRPRPRPRLEGSKTKTKTKTPRFQDQDRDQDSRVPRPRPRPRLVKTGLETSRDQDSSLENSKSVCRVHKAINSASNTLLHCNFQIICSFSERKGSKKTGVENPGQIVHSPCKTEGGQNV